MFTLVLEMHARLPFVPEPYYADFPEEEDFLALQHNIDLLVSGDICLLLVIRITYP